MKDVVWKGLVTSLQNGQCVLVLGPDILTCPSDGLRANGESKSVRDAFCQELAKQLRDENQTVGESALFAVAQQYEDLPAFSTYNLRNLAAEFFRNPGYTPGPVYLKLSRCPFSLILTTCHDDLFAKALRGCDKEPVRYLYHYRGEPRDNRELEQQPSHQSPAIYHLFGAYDDPNSLVLTENDLLDFVIHLISGKPPLPNSLRSSLRNKTFLFVGFGIKHWYIRVLLKLLIRSLELSGGSVALESLGGLAETEREQTVLFYKRGTRVEVVDIEIGAFLEELWQRFQQKGGYLGVADRHIRRAQVFVSYERTDINTAQKLCDSLPSEQFEPWLDRDRLEGGDDWNSKLEQRIQSSDYFLVLNSENLNRKEVGYVNKEVALALDRQKYFQPGKKFIVPIRVGNFPPEQGRADLQSFQQLSLRHETLDEDLALIVKTLTRDFQLRMR